MHVLRKSLMSVAAVLAMAPAAAVALPPQCSEICYTTVNCNKFCAEGTRTTTCGAAGY
jgi:hypothetical protein